MFCAVFHSSRSAAYMPQFPMYMLHSHDILNLMWQNVSRLYSGLSDTEKMQRYVNEEKNIREENLRLQRKLQLEVERREALCRHLSESESR